VVCSTAAVVVDFFTKISNTAAGVVPVLRKLCGVPLFMKNAWPGAAALGASFPIVISSVPATGVHTWYSTSSCT